MELRNRPGMRAIARVPRGVIDDLVGRKDLAGLERSPTKSNKYHGDILFPNGEHMPTWRTRQIQSVLAVNAIRVDV